MRNSKIDRNKLLKMSKKYFDKLLVKKKSMQLVLPLEPPVSSKNPNQVILLIFQMYYMSQSTNCGPVYCVEFDPSYMFVALESSLHVLNFSQPHRNIAYTSIRDFKYYQQISRCIVVKFYFQANQENAKLAHAKLNQ